MAGVGGLYDLKKITGSHHCATDDSNTQVKYSNFQFYSYHIGSFVQYTREYFLFVSVTSESDLFSDQAVVKERQSVHEVCGPSPQAIQH